MRERSLKSPCPVPFRRRARRTRRSRRPRRLRRPRRHENTPGDGVLGPEGDLEATPRADWRRAQPRETLVRGLETRVLHQQSWRGTGAPQEKPERRWRQPSGLQRKICPEDWFLSEIAWVDQTWLFLIGQMTSDTYIIIPSLL